MTTSLAPLFAAEPKPAAQAKPAAGSTPAPSHDYAKAVLDDKPVAYWRLSEAKDGFVTASSSGAEADTLRGAIKGNVAIKEGPRPGPGNTEYVEFEPQNTAADFQGRDGYIVVTDPGDKSVLDFHKGDSITLEAWVNPRSLKNGQYVYVVGKGRTGAKGMLGDNQNYALRLAHSGGTVRPTFVFRDADNRKGVEEDWHRWTATEGFVIDGGWHHVAITYTFGVGKSLRAYVDGYEVKGKWDMGGQTDEAPYVDNDALWIGSSMGGKPESTFNGSLDEVAIYRRALSKDEIFSHYNYVVPAPKVAAQNLPAGQVQVEIVEAVPDRSWTVRLGKVTETYTVPAFGFPAVPRKYNDAGLIADRTGPFLLRAAAVIELPKGTHKLLLRAYNGARLAIDRSVVGMTPFTNPRTDAHEQVPDLAQTDMPNMYPATAGHTDKLITFDSPGGKHLFVLEAQVGGAALRPETGDLSLALLTSEGMYHLVSPKADFRVAYTEEGWKSYKQAQLETFDAMNARNRAAKSADEKKYWDMRHDQARSLIAREPAAKVPAVKSTDGVFNDVDRFINARLEKENITPAPLTDDLAFLRRVTLDTVGMTPSPREIQQFLADKPGERRAKVIDRLLADPRWADHWVAYWQDVLAENPGILKPQLNNTGPFRYWIYESFLDNKPLDQFATELIMMQGSKYYGGPAGFEMATDNDVPMAEKAHTIAQAFLGVEMKCARCHDAPYHDVKQENLFSFAAMLKRGPVQVPMTSSIPGGDARLKKLLVQVTLAPGTAVNPEWQFTSLLPSGAEMPAGFIRDEKDTRETLAAYITSPLNTRFARVMANRLWQRYLGFGIVEPAEDWEAGKPSNPELLSYLSRELVNSGYDVKHLARLILTSHTYQRAIVPGKSDPVDMQTHLFASPMRRRIAAEQLVDSLFAIAGKAMDSEELNMDIDGRQPVSSFNNLGYPSKSWQFTSLSNERDRPALAMPKAQAITDLLKEFGWRESRPNPINLREKDPTVQQPAMLANGVVTRRVISLSDDSAFTQLAVESKTAEEFVNRLHLRIMGREPSTPEREDLLKIIAPGFENRIADANARQKKADVRTTVSWSNHLNAEATKIKLELERIAREGDPPSPRFSADWRSRTEDVIWALINSPEFIFVP